MSSVFGIEKEIPRFSPFSAMFAKILCRQRMLPRSESEATVMEKWSM